MLSLRNDVTLKKDVISEIQSEMAQIREKTLEVEQILKFALKERLLLTKKEVAERLRCEEKKIPRDIPRVRVGNQYLFRDEDVESFIESKRH